MYCLMNKDNIVATFIKNQDPLLPEFELLESQEDKTPIGFQNINAWLENRQVGKHKKHIREIMAECNCLSVEGYIRITHAASLNDTFWVKREDEDVQWKKVSLFVNEFDDVIARISFEGGGLYGKEFSTTTPEFSTDGTFEKCWRRENEKIFLYKRGSSGARNAGLEPFCEVYSSQIAKELCDEAVLYELSNLHGKIASKCELFTSEKIGFSPISLVAQKSMSPRAMLDFYSSIGFEESFRRMVVYDAVTFNTDRHMGNHGILFDTDTLKIIGMAPVFDENLSLLPYAESEDFINLGSYLKSRTPAIGTDFVQVAKSLLTPSIRADLINLKDFEFNLFENDKFPETRVNLLQNVIRQQIDGILDKNKIYTIDVFPDNLNQNQVDEKINKESVIEKLRRNQEQIKDEPM